MSSINIGNVETFSKLTEQSDKLVLVDFWAQWCGPCKNLGPVLEEIANENSEKVQIAKVNVDDFKELAANYGIRSIPTMLLFKNGQVQSTLVGNLPKSEIIKKIEELV